jgi:hypothetical protein
MLEKLKERVGTFLLIRQLKRNVTVEINFNNFISSSNSILVICPEEPADFQFASEIGSYLLSIGKSVTVFLPEYKLNVLSIKNKVKSLTYGSNDISWLGLPAKEFRRNLETFACDVAIDLNLKDSLFASATTNYIKSKFKIGFVKSNSDLYYNFQLPNQINNENSYRNLLNSFRMF